MNILYFEKIRGREFSYDDDDQYDPSVVAIAQGERDTIKQDALYIDLDKSCRVKNAPINITRDDADAEYKRAERYGSILRTLISQNAIEGIQLAKLKEAMKIVFWQDHKSASADAYRPCAPMTKLNS